MDEKGHAELEARWTAMQERAEAVGGQILDLLQRECQSPEEQDMVLARVRLNLRGLPSAEAPPSNEPTTHHDRMFALHDQFAIEAYDAGEELIRDVLEETADLDVRDAVSVMRQVTGMLHDRCEDLDGLALARMHGLDLDELERDNSRDKMIAQYKDPEATLDEFLHPEHDYYFHWARVFRPKEKPAEQPAGEQGGAGTLESARPFTMAEVAYRVAVAGLPAGQKGGMVAESKQETYLSFWTEKEPQGRRAKQPLWVVHVEYPGDEGEQTHALAVPAPTAHEAQAMVVTHYRGAVEQAGAEFARVLETPVEEQG